MGVIDDGVERVASIVLLEDDQIFSAALQAQLEALGYSVTHFEEGQKCLNYLAQNTCDLCLFDLDLPGISGFDVMVRLRVINKMPPVIFVAGNDDEATITKILVGGADDYVVKPPTIYLLSARIQAVLRRIRWVNQKIKTEVMGGIFVDHVNKVIRLDGAPVNLTGSEALLAFHLFLNRGQIVSRKSLYEILGIDLLAVETRRIDVHISNLRRKLKLNAMNGWRLSSIHQKGYRLEYLGDM